MRCTAQEIGFAVADPHRRLTGVRLVQHLGLPADQLTFGYHPAAGQWRLRLPRPAVWRMEYRFELRHADGRTEVVCDPANDRRAGDPFGDRSELICPEYAEPGWLRSTPTDGRWWELTVPVLDRPTTVRIRSPQVPTARVLLVHDGPDYDRYAALGRYSAAGIVAPHHLVLLDAGHRDEWYSADPRYARALGTVVLPRVRAQLRSAGPVVGVGASLGALALLHAQRLRPELFAALFLQSGSFFTPRHDRQESSFRRWLRIVRFTGRVARAAEGPAVPTVLTCGSVEENLANNRAMAQVLARHGYPVALHEVPDAHTWTGWRDALDPHLTNLLHRVWPRLDPDRPG